MMTITLDQVRPFEFIGEENYGDSVGIDSIVANSPSDLVILNADAKHTFLNTAAINPSSTALVNLFYNDVLHRTPQQFETGFWAHIIDSGQQSRAEVLKNFSESAENQAQVIGVIQNGFEYKHYD